VTMRCAARQVGAHPRTAPRDKARHRGSTRGLGCEPPAATAPMGLGCEPPAATAPMGLGCEPPAATAPTAGTAHRIVGTASYLGAEGEEERARQGRVAR